MHFERDESNDQQNSKKLQRKQTKEKLSLRSEKRELEDIVSIEGDEKTKQTQCKQYLVVQKKYCHNPSPINYHPHHHHHHHQYHI